MRNIRVNTLILSAILWATITNAQEKNFKTDAKTGVEYRFIKHDKKGAAPKADDIARVTLLWTGTNAKGNADSVYFDSRQRGGDSVGAIYLPLKASFHGCLEQGVMMMTPGDSAAFKINADSFYIKAFRIPPGRIPHFITGSTLFTFNVKLLNFKTEDEIKAERDAQMENRKGEEPKEITAYLQKNNLNVAPDADSIFYLQTTKGAGPQVQEGDSVEIRYKGTYLAGGVFDPGSRPINMVYSKNMRLIPGWVKIIGKMNQGDKVRVLIPSEMGYGARGMGPIQPYTPLIFDMEMVSVKANK